MKTNTDRLPATVAKALAAQASAGPQDASPAPQELPAALQSPFNLLPNHRGKTDMGVPPPADSVSTDTDPQERCDRFAAGAYAVGLDVRARLEKFSKGLKPSPRAPLAAAVPAGRRACQGKT